MADARARHRGGRFAWPSMSCATAEPLRSTAGPEPTREGCGAFASEILEPACWALLHTADDAIVRAVNLVGDDDTRGAVSGAPAGAWGGASALSAGWVDQFENGAALVRLADQSLAATAQLRDRLNQRRAEE